jgi:hypothetical protein
MNGSESKHNPNRLELGVADTIVHSNDGLYVSQETV